MSVWGKDELDREQVKGLFAIAVLASIGAYFVSGGYKIATPTPASTALFALIDVDSFILLMFWSLYVVTAAISMTWWNPKWFLSPLLGWFKLISRWCFAMGSATSLIFAVIFLPQVFYLEIQTYSPTNQVLTYVFLIVSFGAFVGLSFYGRHKRNINQTRGPAPSPADKLREQVTKLDNPDSEGKVTPT